MFLLHRFSKISRSVHPITFILCVAVFNAVFYNQTVVQALAPQIHYQSFSDVWLVVCLWMLGVFCSFVPLLPFVFKHTLKPAVWFFCCANASTLYFMNTYHVMIDKGMIQNIFMTSWHEMAELLSWPWLLSVLGYGGGVALLFGFIPVRYERPSVQWAIKLISILLLATLVTAGTLLSNYPKFITFARVNKDYEYSFIPYNYIMSTVRYIKEQFKHKKTPITPILEDAIYLPTEKPTLVVLVIGETARSQNFSLYGYKRHTNPLLAKSGAIPLNALSCGTSTAVSVPCLFSHLEGEAFRKNKTRYMFLPESLQKLGISIDWADNNFGGCYGPCRFMVHQVHTRFKDKALCDPEGCWDEVLLKKLDVFLESPLEQSKLVVLHMNGSHGPLYYKRYPPAFEVFRKACKKRDLNTCTEEELVNAYDNTLLYTDYLLNSILDRLKARADIASLFLYVSDHGESLGEYNLFLHGFPYFIAPKEQKEIPFLVYLNAKFQQEHMAQLTCLKDSEQVYSHDNIFHTLLGAFNIQTRYYKPELDILKQCSSN